MRNGTLLPYHARVADHIFGIPKGKKIKEGKLFYLSEISADKVGLVFTFASCDLYRESFVTDGMVIDGERNARMKIRFAMTPAQIAALTPAAVKQMTDRFFTVSPASVHLLIITPDQGW